MVVVLIQMEDKMELKFEDFKNPLFNVWLKRRKHDDWVEDGEVIERGEEFFDGITFTDNYRQVGFTYYPKTGMLYISCLTSDGNIRLFEGAIESIDDFEAAIKKADKKITRRQLKVIALY